MSAYRILHRGAWRPVIQMFRGQQQVYHPEQANAVVAEVDGEYLACLVSPGEIFTEWMPLVPPESNWDKVED